MEAPKRLLQRIFGEAIASIDGLTAEDCKAEVAVSTQPEFGHYQCNNAMRLGKKLRCNPREVAQQIIANLDRSELECVEIAGPGFINITLSKEFIARETNRLLRDMQLGVELPTKAKRIIVEFSSPNIAKELHVGHLRSSIIGDCLARLFEFLGHDVLRLNHVGDWGTQFGMLITFLKEKHPEVFSGESEDADLSQLMCWYRESKQLFDADNAFKERSRNQVVSLQGGEKEAKEAWKRICDISRCGFQEIYDLLDIKLKERGESFYNQMLPGVVEDLEKKGLVTVSNGAKCIFLEEFKGREGEPLPMIIQKADGGFNYSTTDMAALRHRLEEEKADEVIMVVDLGQSLHFKMLLSVAEKAGYLDPSKKRVEHVGFGLVCGSDGKKFKTRSGETEKLIDLINEAVVRARHILDERDVDFPDEEKSALAKAIGIGAIKYADLSSDRKKDYIFSYDRMLQFEGNTASFLLYAYARIQQVKRKSDKVIDDLIDVKSIELDHTSEVVLALKLLRFAETLEVVAEELMPHKLCTYLFELVEIFNIFYRDCQVIGNEEEESRLLLVEATGRVLKQGLSILGIRSVQRM